MFLLLFFCDGSKFNYRPRFFLIWDSLLNDPFVVFCWSRSRRRAVHILHWCPWSWLYTSWLSIPGGATSSVAWFDAWKSWNMSNYVQFLSLRHLPSSMFSSYSVASRLLPFRFCSGGAQLAAGGSLHDLLHVKRLLLQEAGRGWGMNSWIVNHH